jgi:hypothetical protein
MRIRASLVYLVISDITLLMILQFVLDKIRRSAFSPGLILGPAVMMIKSASLQSE